MQIGKLPNTVVQQPHNASSRTTAAPESSHQPTESFASSVRSPLTYGPGLLQTQSGRPEPLSVDRTAIWTRPDNAHLLPVDRSGQSWSLSKLSKSGPDLVRQGPVGDCYEEAPTASALEQDPRLVTSTTRCLGTSKGVGYYGVAFFVPTTRAAAGKFDRAGDDVTRTLPDGKPITYTPVWVVVDDLFPQRQDATPMSSDVKIASIHQNVLLNAIREKALGELHGVSGYRNIDHGGNAGEFMETLSGFPSTVSLLDRSSDPRQDKKLADQQFQTLVDAHQAGLLTTVNTRVGDVRAVRKNLRDFTEPAVKGYARPYFDADKFVFRDGAGNAASTAGSGQQSGKDSREGYGWVGRHEYSVMNAWEDNGTKMVRLRNPWGDLCPPEFADHNSAGQPVQTGYVNIPWYLARQLLESVKVGGRPAEEHDKDVALPYPPKHGFPKGLVPAA